MMSNYRGEADPSVNAWTRACGIRNILVGRPMVKPRVHLLLSRIHKSRVIPTTY